MTFQLIVFIAAILFGILLYWRESKGNAFYRVVNKIFNSEELQMKATERKGFVYKQSFLLRLVYIAIFFLVGLIVIRFILPIQMATVSFFLSMIAGTLIGTYISNLVFKSTAMIEEQTENLEGIMHDTLEKGKDFIEDLKEDMIVSMQKQIMDDEASPKKDEESEDLKNTDSDVNAENTLGKFGMQIQDRYEDI